MQTRDKRGSVSNENGWEWKIEQGREGREDRWVERWVGKGGSNANEWKERVWVGTRMEEEEVKDIFGRWI